MVSFHWFKDEEVTVSNEMSALDITCFALIPVQILVLILYFVYHKCKKLQKLMSL